MKELKLASDGVEMAGELSADWWVLDGLLRLVSSAEVDAAVDSVEDKISSPVVELLDVVVSAAVVIVSTAVVVVVEVVVVEITSTEPVDAATSDELLATDASNELRLLLASPVTGGAVAVLKSPDDCELLDK